MIIHNPILTGSFTVNGTDVASITSSAASITAINAYTASQNILNGTYATTGSNTFTSPQTINSNLTVTGSITAQTLVVQTITSSVDFVTGSTRFGSILGNTHVFSGSVTMNPGGLFVSSSGIVGIGTSSPNTKLQIEDGHISTYHNINTDGAGYGVQFYTNGGGSKNTIATIDISQVGTTRSSNMIFLTSNVGAPTERMRITSSGSVGIGTSSPNANLTVWTPSTTGLQTALRLNNPFGFTNANTGAKIVFSQDRTTSEDYPMSEIGAGQESPGSSSAGYIFFSTRNSSIISERMRILSAGNVGIGTSNPSAKLHLYDGTNPLTLKIQRTSVPVYFSDVQTGGTIAGAAWSHNVENTSNGSLSWGSFNNEGYAGAAMLLNSANSTSWITFYTAASVNTNPTERMRIDGSGYITKPYNPAFRAYYSVNSNWILAPSDTFVFNTTEYNIGSCYNTSNGRFTAPVAGVYQFNFYSIYYGPITNGFIQFKKNSAAMTSGTNLHFSSTNSSTSWNNVQFNTSVYLNSGDYITLENKDFTVNYHGDDWSSFSGYLVG